MTNKLPVNRHCVLNGLNNFVVLYYMQTVILTLIWATDYSGQSRMQFVGYAQSGSIIFCAIDGFTGTETGHYLSKTGIHPVF